MSDWQSYRRDLGPERSTMVADIAVREVTSGRGQIASALLARLPEWFGRPESTLRYVADAEGQAMLAAFSGDDAVGFVSLAPRTETALEVVVMGVLPEHHRRGIGRQLLVAAEAHCRATDRPILFVRTLGERHPDLHYATTRAFYRAAGFLPVEEIADLWGADTPSLLLVKFVAAGL